MLPSVILLMLTDKVRKISGVLFILLGFVPLLLSLIFILYENKIHRRMEEKMESGHLTTLVIPENKVIWMEKHEIWVNNSMFDIHTKELENGVYTFTGMYDEEETKLVEQERKTEEENNGQQKMLTQLFKSLPEFHNDTEGLPDFLYRQRIYISFESSKPDHPFRKIHTPPPRNGFV